MRPLKLRDEILINNALVLAWQIKRLRFLLGSKEDLKKSPIASSLKKVHEQLRMNLKKARYIGLRKLFNFYLIDVMHNSEAQVEVLPSIEITLDEKTKTTM